MGQYVVRTVYVPPITKRKPKKRKDVVNIWGPFPTRSKADTFVKRWKREQWWQDWENATISIQLLHPPIIVEDDPAANG